MWVRRLGMGVGVVVMKLVVVNEGINVVFGLNFWR